MALFVCRFLKSERKNRRELTACVPASLIDDAISERVRITRGEDTRMRTIGMWGGPPIRFGFRYWFRVVPH